MKSVRDFRCISVPSPGGEEELDLRFLPHPPELAVETALPHTPRDLPAVDIGVRDYLPLDFDGKVGNPSTT